MMVLNLPEHSSVNQPHSPFERAKYS